MSDADNEQRQGGICYLEIPAPDLEKAKQFYGEVFGWTFEDVHESYCFFRDGQIGGGLDPDLPVAVDGVRLYLSVREIPSTLERIFAKGGEILRDKTAIGDDFGFYAHFRDPNGNSLGIWSKA